MHISKSKKCFNVKSSTYQDKDISRFKKKADHNHNQKLFQAPKITSKSPKLIGPEVIVIWALFKRQKIEVTFLREPTFQVLAHGSPPLKKT